MLLSNYYLLLNITFKYLIHTLYDYVLGILLFPYEVMFGNKMKIGLVSSINPKNILLQLRTEEDLEVARL